MSTIGRGTRNVLRNPIRLVLVVLLLGTSLTFVAAMLALDRSAQDRVALMQSQVGVNIDIWDPYADEHGTELSSQQLQQAEQTPGVARFVERLGTSYQGYELNPLGRASQILVSGSSSGADLEVKGGAAVRISAGRTFSASEENANLALMSTALAQANHLRLGAHFPLEGTTLTLIGLYDTGTVLGDDSIMLPITTAVRVFQAPGVGWLTVFARNVNQVPALAHALRGRLNSHIDLATHDGEVAGTLAALTTIQHNSASTLVAALVTATLVIVVAVALTVRERTREIGILKAIGASNGQVIRQFAVETISLSAMATLAAALLLLVAGDAIAQAFDIAPTVSNPAGSSGGPKGSSPAPTNQGPAVLGSAGHHLLVTLTPQTLLALFGIGMLLAVVASIIPAWAVARLKPAPVLRMV